MQKQTAKLAKNYYFCALNNLIIHYLTMMKKILPLCLGAIIAASCTDTQKSNDYTVVCEGGNAEYTGMVYITDATARVVVDSAEMVNGALTFTGKIDTPVMAIINSRDAGLGGMFVLEPGNIKFTNGYASTGTPLNDELTGFFTTLNELDSIARADSLSQDDLSAQMAAAHTAIVENHTNDVLGLFMLTQFDYLNNGAETLLGLVAKCDTSIQNSKAIQAKKVGWEAQAKTAPGAMFTDFEVEYDGKVTKLSDYVGKGKYILADFWASWCGPCRRAIPGIIELYNKYHGDKFDVLGIATWDEPEASIKAIEEMKMPWPQILNAQKIGSDAYGVQGIPQIILFGPDGTIVARDLHGDALVQAVEKAMAE